MLTQYKLAFTNPQTETDCQCVKLQSQITQQYSPNSNIPQLQPVLTLIVPIAQTK